MFNDHHITPQEHDEWFRRIIGDPTCRYWIIVFDDKDVGLTCIYRVSLVHKVCYWAIYIADTKFRGKNVGSAAEYLVMKHVFDELGFNKLICEVLAGNESAVNLYKSLGFQTEGVLRQQVVKEGQPMDVIVLGILRQEWVSRKLAIQGRPRMKALLQ